MLTDAFHVTREGTSLVGDMWSDREAWHICHVRVHALKAHT